jgi:hypothetical protein
MPLIAAAHQSHPWEVMRALITIAVTCSPPYDSDPQSDHQTQSNDEEAQHPPSPQNSEDSANPPHSPSLEDIQNTSRRIPAPQQQQSTPALRIAHWNACGLTERKWTVLSIVLERQGVDACVITETKWTYCSTRDYLDRSGWSCLRTDYQEMPDSHTDTSKLQRGGVALLLPPNTEVSAHKIRSWQQNCITATTWKLTRPDWKDPVFLTGIYKSPGQNLDAGDIAEDIQTMAEIMTSVAPTFIHVITGDFNTHTADEQDCTRHSLLPPQRGYNLPVNNMGQALLRLLQSINWTILTNRFQHGDTLYSCSVVYDNHNQTEQKACIDYFLIHNCGSQAKSIRGEAILKDSGSEIGRSDHNLCLLDLTLDPNEAGAPTEHVDMLPFPPRTFCNIRDLTT